MVIYIGYSISTLLKTTHTNNLTILLKQSQTKKHITFTERHSLNGNKRIIPFSELQSPFSFHKMFYGNNETRIAH